MKPHSISPVRRRRFALVLGLALALIAGAASAQRKKPPQPSAEQSDFATNIVLVNTTLTVTDRNGRFVAGLSKDDFEVLEDGVPQRVSEFSRESTLPLRFALLLDRSESVRGRFLFEQEAAGSFLSQIMKNERDLGLAVAFDSNVFLLQDFTSDPALLAGAVKKLTVAGGTSLLDAIYKTCRDKFLAADTGSRRVILAITDGEDTTSRVTVDQVRRMALQAGVVVYAIGVKSEGRFGASEERGPELLRKLCQQTGGAASFLGEKDSRLAPLYQQIENELRNQYSIGYYSANPVFDGRYHAITFRIKSGDYHVHARLGYYASKL